MVIYDSIVIIRFIALRQMVWQQWNTVIRGVLRPLYYRIHFNGLQMHYTYKNIYNDTKSGYKYLKIVLQNF